MKIFNAVTKKVGKDDKAHWLPVGTFFEGEKGISGYMHANPEAQIYLFEKKPFQQTQNTQAPAQNLTPSDPNSLPF